MESNWQFLAVSNFNTGNCVMVPFNNIVHPFIVAQSVSERIKDLYFHEVLSAIKSQIFDENVFDMPFGYDGINMTVCLYNHCMIVRDNLKPIEAEQMVYKPVPYVIIDGVPMLNTYKITDAIELRGKVISKASHTMSQRMIDEVGFELYFSKGFERFDYEKVDLEMVALFEKGEDFTYDNVRYEIRVAETFEDFLKVFPKYGEVSE